MAFYQSSFYKPNQPIAGLPKVQPVQQQQVTPTPTKVLPQARALPQAAPIAQQPVVSSQPAVQRANTYMQGGVLNKVFDALRTPEYALSGFVQGNRQRAEQLQTQAKKTGQTAVQKYGVGGILDTFSHGVGNIISGIQKRASFSNQPGDYNAGAAYGVKPGLGQDAINAATSLTSPSLALGKLKNLPGIKQGVDFLGKGLSKVSQVAKQTPLAYKTIENFNPYFRNPEAGKVIEGAQQQTRSKVNDLFTFIQGVSKNLNPQEQAEVGRVLEGGATQNPKLLPIIQPLKNVINKIGKDAVDAGLLSQETYSKFRGNYMTHIWEQTNQKKDPILNVKSLFPKVSGEFFKQRKGKEGYIQQFAPALFKGLGTEVKDINTVNLYKDIAQKFGKPASDLTQDASKLIKSEKVGKYFKGVTLPNEVVDYMNRLVDTPKKNAFDKALDIWKSVKTIYNPAYHVRNVMSNQILSDMSTGEGLPKTTLNYLRSVSSYAGRGSQNFVNAAQRAGLIKNPNFYESVDEFIKKAGFGKSNVVQKIGNLPKKLQTVTEETAKLNVFKTWIEKQAQRSGVTVDEALKNDSFVKNAVSKAEEAIFSPYRISQGERSLVGRTIPFYSFTRQALPFTAKTAINNPGRLTKYAKAKDIVENQSPNDSIPSNVAPENIQQQIRLPIKNDKGANVYLDPQYIYPFGNFGDTGGSKGQLPFGLSLNPFFQEATSQLGNYDPYYQAPITSSNVPSQQIKDRLSHARRTFAPTAVNTVVDKLVPAFKGQPDYTGIPRNKGQAVLDAMGIKSKTYDSEQLRSKGENKNLQQMRSFEKEYNQVLQDPTLDEVTRSQRLREIKDAYDQFSQGAR